MASTRVGDWLPVDDWIARIPPLLGYLEEVVLAEEDIELDFSAPSLDRLERYLLDRFESPDDLERDADTGWVIPALAAYLGEVSLRTAGGGWLPVQAPDQVPPAAADPALRLPEMTPLDLVQTVVRTRIPGQFRAAHDAWARAVQHYQAAHPSWVPVKRLTPGVDPVPVDEAAGDADLRHLTMWLSNQERAFPGWVEEHGAGADWDFSRHSLDALGALVLRVTPTMDEFGAAGHAGFVDVASWYLGETMRRARGGQWRYRHGDPDLDVYAGYPYVARPEPDSYASVPLRVLRMVVKRGDPHLVRQPYDFFVA